MERHAVERGVKFGSCDEFGAVLLLHFPKEAGQFGVWYLFLPAQHETAERR